MRRYRIQPTNFDTRVLNLEEPKPTWDKKVIALHEKNKASLINVLKLELGENNFELKLQNFKDLGKLPFSIVSHHNVLFHQARYAFIQGYYYPALTSACALGERILNHLILDLREFYPVSSVDKKSHKRKSIDDWQKAIDTLEEWGVLQASEVNEAFKNLSLLRHRSLHFNLKTIETLRDDALTALSYLSTIIEKQFGFLVDKIISGTKGAFFLRKTEEQDPFIRKYYLKQSFHVSPYHAFRFIGSVSCVFDYGQNVQKEITDDEFLRLFNNRSFDDLAPTEIPWSDNIVAFALVVDEVREIAYDPESVQTANEQNKT